MISYGPPRGGSCAGRVEFHDEPQPRKKKMKRKTRGKKGAKEFTRFIVKPQK